ncbi:MAG: AI-2E family transporter [Candidatus Schekmanbacteria bacterium]|nr:AI-2E family transporter [Candidatus Schekmanbacteria bacterium]
MRSRDARSSREIDTQDEPFPVVDPDPTAAHLGTAAINRLTALVSQPRFWVILMATGLGLYLVSLTLDALKTVFGSAVIAYILDDLITRLERHRVPRVVGVLLVLILGLGVALLTLVWLLPRLVSQLSNIVADVPAIAGLVTARIQHLQQQYAQLISTTYGEQLVTRIASEVERLGSSLVNTMLVGITGTLANLFNGVVVLFLVFEFLRDKKLILGWLSRFLPRPDSRFSAVMREVDREMGHFLRGKLIVIVLLTSAASVAYSILGLESSLFLGVLTGLATVVPYFGAVVVFFPVLLVAYYSHGSTTAMIQVGVTYLILQTIEGYVVSPWVVGHYSRIHPAAVVISILVFGSVWGMWGVILAVPGAIVIRGFLDELARWVSEQHAGSTPAAAAGKAMSSVGAKTPESNAATEGVIL